MKKFWKGTVPTAICAAVGATIYIINKKIKEDKS